MKFFERNSSSMKEFIFILILLVLLKFTTAFNPYDFDESDPCSRRCHRYYAPVCGSDGETYHSECIMLVYACKRQQRIRVKHVGKCRPSAIPDVVVCPRGCSSMMVPVCGTDYVVYDNECMLKKEACEHKPSLKKLCDGFCPGTGILSRCALTFRMDYRPMCATDGRTYLNQAVINVAACQSNNPSLRRFSYGPCGTDHRKRRKCRKLRCEMYTYEPVCGIDSRTYDNSCIMQYENCLDGNYAHGAVRTLYNGECTIKVEVPPKSKLTTFPMSTHDLQEKGGVTRLDGRTNTIKPTQEMTSHVKIKGETFQTTQISRTIQQTLVTNKLTPHIEVSDTIEPTQILDTTTEERKVIQKSPEIVPKTIKPKVTTDKVVVDEKITIKPTAVSESTTEDEQVTELSPEIVPKTIEPKATSDKVVVDEKITIKPTAISDSTTEEEKVTKKTPEIGLTTIEPTPTTDKVIVDDKVTITPTAFSHLTTEEEQATQKIPKIGPTTKEPTTDKVIVDDEGTIKPTAIPDSTTEEEQVTQETIKIGPKTIEPTLTADKVIVDEKKKIESTAIPDLTTEEVQVTQKTPEIRPMTRLPIATTDKVIDEEETIKPTVTPDKTIEEEQVTQKLETRPKTTEPTLTKDKVIVDEEETITIVIPDKTTAERKIIQKSPEIELKTIEPKPTTDEEWQVTQKTQEIHPTPMTSKVFVDKQGTIRPTKIPDTTIEKKQETKKQTLETLETVKPIPTFDALDVTNENTMDPNIFQGTTIERQKVTQKPTPQVGKETEKLSPTTPEILESSQKTSHQFTDSITIGTDQTGEPDSSVRKSLPPTPVPPPTQPAGTRGITGKGTPSPIIMELLTSDSTVNATVSLSTVTMSEELVPVISSTVNKTFILTTSESKIQSKPPPVFSTTSRPVEVVSTTAKFVSVDQETGIGKQFVTSLKPEITTVPDVFTTPQITDIVSNEVSGETGSGEMITSNKVSGFMSTFKQTPIPQEEQEPTEESHIGKNYTHEHPTGTKSIKDDGLISATQKTSSIPKADSVIGDFTYNVSKTQASKNTAVMHEELTTPDTEVEIQQTKTKLAIKTTPIVEIIEDILTTLMPNDTDLEEQSTSTSQGMTSATVGENMVATTHSVTPTSRSDGVASTTAKSVTVDQQPDIVEQIATSLKAQITADINVFTTEQHTDIVSKTQDGEFGSGVDEMVTSDKISGFMRTFTQTPISYQEQDPTQKSSIGESFTQTHPTGTKSIKDKYLITAKQQTPPIPGAGSTTVASKVDISKTQAPEDIEEVHEKLTTLKSHTKIDITQPTPSAEIINPKTAISMPIDLEKQSTSTYVNSASFTMEGGNIVATTPQFTPNDLQMMTTGESGDVIKTKKETLELTTTDSIADTTISFSKVTMSKDLNNELTSGVSKTIISTTTEDKLKSHKPMPVVDVFSTTVRPVEIPSTAAKAITVQQKSDGVEKLVTSLKPESSAFVDASTTPQVTHIVSKKQDVEIGSGVKGNETSDKLSGFISTFKPTPIPSNEHKPTPEADVIDRFTQKHLTDGKSVKDDKTQAPEEIDISDKGLTTIIPDTTVEVHQTTTKMAEKSTPIVEVIHAKQTTPMPIKTDLDEQSVSPSVKPTDLATTSDPTVGGGKMSAATQSVTPMQQPNVVQTTTSEPVAVMKTDKETLELTTSDSIAHTTISLSKVTMSQELVNASTTLQLTDVVSEGQVVEIGSGIEGKVTSDKVSGFISTFKPTPIPSKEHKPTTETDVIDGFTQKHSTDGKSIKDDKTQAPEKIDIMEKELSTIIPDTTVE
ncbi:flocculation protein FLO9-like, partial [Anneissia japonica]|uniref:flocculation protein FLO9-like n=1 Tax=Anneissia japonica TaxID=1529436 RepID=UPI001425A4BB